MLQLTVVEIPKGHDSARAFHAQIEKNKRWLSAEMDESISTERPLMERD